MPGRAEPDDHALGRPCGGLSTKVHLPSASRARPLALRITGGQAGDAPAFETIMASIHVPRTGDAEAYKQRNAVERCINRFRQWRSLAMRTDKLAITYQAALHLAAILVWARRWPVPWHQMPGCFTCRKA